MPTTRIARRLKHGLMLVGVLGGLASAWPASQANAAWNEVVGGADPFGQTAGSKPSMAAVGGVPYVAWTEGNTTVRVSRLNAAGTAWESVADDPSATVLGFPTAPTVTSVDGVAYVAWISEFGTTPGVEVRRLNAAGTGWEEVGTGPISPPEDVVVSLSLASVGGVPYVAWADDAFSGAVSRLNAAGTAWETVGGAGPFTGRRANTPSLASVDGVPYVAWSESTTESSLRDGWVSRLNAAGTAWETVGAGPFDHSVSTGAPVTPSLTSIGGVPYVAWREADTVGAPFGSEVRVSRLNAAGTQWDEVVGGPSPINESPGRAMDALISLTSIGGVPYLAWTEVDVSGGRRTLRVSGLNAAGTAWTQIVGGANPINNSPTEDASNPSLISIGGAPYVSWAEDGLVRVSRLEPELSNPQAMETGTGAVLFALVRSFGVPSPIAFEYGTGSSLGSRTPTLTAPGENETNIVYQQLDGLTPSTAYTFRAIGFDGTYASAPSATATFTTGLAPTVPPVETITIPGPTVTVTTPGPTVTTPGPTVTTPGATITTPAPPAALFAVIVNPVTTVKSGAAVKLRYLATASGSAVLEIRLGKQRVARVVANTKAGRNTIAWNGKTKRKAAPAGRYTLKLTITSRNGQTTADTAKLTVKKRATTKQHTRR